MLYNRKLSTLEFFNIARTLPIVFLEKYKSLTSEQCNEIVFMKDSNDKTIFDYYAVQDDAKLLVLEYIVFNLSIENFEKVILIPGAHKRTLLHNLLIRKNNTEAFLTKLAEKLSADIFKKFTLLQDYQGQTILHNGIQSYEMLFQKYKDNPEVIDTFNQALLIQDSKGDTCLHRLERPFVLDFCPTNVLLKALTIYNNQKISFLDHALLNQVNLNILDKLSGSIVSLSSHRYPEAILRFLAVHAEKLKVAKKLKLNDLGQYYPESITNKLLIKKCLETLAKAMRDIIANLLSINPSQDTNSEKYYDYSLELAILLDLINEYIAYAYHHEGRLLSLEKTILKELFDVITPAVFFKILENPLTQRFTDVIWRHNFRYLYRFLGDFKLYQDKDPLRMFDLFTDELAFLPLWIDPREIIFPRNFQDEDRIRLKKIIVYQITLGGKADVRYLNILPEINTILTQFNEVDPARRLMLEKYKNELYFLSVLLDYAIYQKTESLLEMEIRDGLDISQYEYSALICAREIEKIQDDRILKAKLQLQVLRFQYRAAKIFEGQDARDGSVESKNPIHQLNLTVNSYLETPHETIHMSIIDEDSYNQAIFEIVNTLQEAIDKDHANYLEQFKTYIEIREQVQPGMFSNTANDLQARKAYYVLLKTPNHTIDDVRAKLRTILNAQSDRQITKGISKQCLGFVNQLKSDCENYIYLDAVKTEFNEELQAVAVEEIEDRHVLQR